MKLVIRRVRILSVLKVGVLLHLLLGITSAVILAVLFFTTGFGFRLPDLPIQPRYGMGMNMGPMEIVLAWAVLWVFNLLILSLTWGVAAFTYNVVAHFFGGIQVVMTKVPAPEE